MAFRQLLGEYDCKLDAKGRMRLPSGLISQLGEGEKHTLIINRGFEKCLVLYPEDVWKKISGEIDALNIYNKQNRNFARYFYRGAQELTMDNADRILLPKRLMEYAGIENEVILSAYNGRIEVWAKDEYDQMMEDEPMDFSDLADEVLGKIGQNKEE